MHFYFKVVLFPTEDKPCGTSAQAMVDLLTRIFSDRPCADYNDPSDPDSDPGRQLQAAEKRLQTEIQLAINAHTGRESTNA